MTSDRTAAWKLAAMATWWLVMLAAWIGWIAWYGPKPDLAAANVFGAWAVMSFVGLLLIANVDRKP